MKKKLDIERLLHWAYRDELPKQSAVGSSSSWADIARYGALGAVIDDQIGPAMRLPEILGEPHPDAIEIARHVRALVDVDVEWSSSREGLMGDLLALAPENAVIRPLRTEALIVMHAKMGTRPDWFSGPPTCSRITGRNGKPIVQLLSGERIEQGRTKGRHYGPGARCPLKWEPTPESIALDRAEYAAWHRGLCVLAAALRDALIEHVPHAPAAPEQPWNTGPQAAAHVIDGQPIPMPKAEPRDRTARPPLRYRPDTKVRRPSGS